MQGNSETVKGWTLDQWSIVAGRLGVEKVETWSDVRSMYVEYRRRFARPPGEVVLCGVREQKNQSVAIDVFYIADQLRLPRDLRG